MDPKSLNKASNVQDPVDYTDKYNTILTKDEEQKYEDWAKNGNPLGRDLSNDTYDYDLRGYWKKYGNNFNGDKETGHLTDEFKKPNHPTFSDQSKYNGVDNNAGGKWEQTSDGKWSFTPSKSTIKLLGKDKIKQYWSKAESSQGNVLKIE